MVETVQHQDRLRSIRIVIRAKGWPERVHTLTYDKRNNLEQTMAAAQTDLQELVSLLLKEEYPV